MQSNVVESKDLIINKLLDQIINKYPKLNVNGYKNNTDFEVDKLLTEIQSKNSLSIEASENILELTRD